MLNEATEIASSRHAPRNILLASNTPSRTHGHPRLPRRPGISRSAGTHHLPQKVTIPLCGRRHKDLSHTSDRPTAQISMKNEKPPQSKQRQKKYLWWRGHCYPLTDHRVLTARHFPVSLVHKHVYPITKCNSTVLERALCRYSVYRDGEWEYLRTTKLPKDISEEQLFTEEHHETSVGNITGFLKNNPLKIVGNMVWSDHYPRAVDFIFEIQLPAGRELPWTHIKHPILPAQAPCHLKSNGVQMFGKLLVVLHVIQRCVL